MVSRAETKKIDKKKINAVKQLAINTVQSKSTGLNDTTSAGVSRNPSWIARNKTNIPNVARPVPHVRKQPKRQDSPKAVELIDWKKQYNAELLCSDETKQKGKGTIDLTFFTLDGTNQPVTIKNFKELDNKDFGPTQKYE